MGIPNKQIGWSTEDNLLWLIAKQVEQLSRVIAANGGGGGGGVTSVNGDTGPAVVLTASDIPSIAATYVPYTGATQDVDLTGVDLYAQRVIIGGWEPTYYGYELGQDHVGLFRENGDTPIATYDGDYHYAGYNLSYTTGNTTLNLLGKFHQVYGVNDGISDYSEIYANNYDVVLVGISGSDGDNFGLAILVISPEQGITGNISTPTGNYNSNYTLHNNYLTVNVNADDNSPLISHTATDTDASLSTVVQQNTESWKVMNNDYGDGLLGVEFNNRQAYIGDYFNANNNTNILVNDDGEYIDVYTRDLNLNVEQNISTNVGNEIYSSAIYNNTNAEEINEFATLVKQTSVTRNDSDGAITYTVTDTSGDDDVSTTITQKAVSYNIKSQQFSTDGLFGIDFTTKICHLGDIADTFTGTKIVLNADTEQIELVAEQTIDISSGNFRVNSFISGNQKIRVYDEVVELGDQGDTNNTHVNIDDSAETIEMVANNGATLNGNQIANKAIQHIDIPNSDSPVSYQIVPDGSDRIIVTYTETNNGAEIFLPPVAANAGLQISIVAQIDNDPFEVTTYGAEGAIMFTTSGLQTTNSTANFLNLISTGTIWVLVSSS